MRWQTRGRSETGRARASPIDSTPIPASEIFRTDDDTRWTKPFPPVDEPLGAAATLETSRIYRLWFSATNPTRYAIGYSKRHINIGWPAWLGRGEYSTDGGATWTGMHAYGTDDRHRSMAPYNNISG